MKTRTTFPQSTVKPTSHPSPNQGHHSLKVARLKVARAWLILPTLLTLIVSTANTALSQTVQVGVGLQPDPTVLKGVSGGSRSSNCGNVSATPNQTLNVTAAIPFMRLQVKGSPSATLLIEGPGGRFCVMADGSDRPLEQTGFWSPGTYSVFVGERTNGSNPYTLTISQSQ